MASIARMILLAIRKSQIGKVAARATGVDDEAAVEATEDRIGAVNNH